MSTTDNPDNIIDLGRAFDNLKKEVKNADRPTHDLRQIYRVAPIEIDVAGPFQKFLDFIKPYLGAGSMILHLPDLKLTIRFPLNISQRRWLRPNGEIYYASQPKNNYDQMVKGGLKAVGPEESWGWQPMASTWKDLPVCKETDE